MANKAYNSMASEVEVWNNFHNIARSFSQELYNPTKTALQTYVCEQIILQCNIKIMIISMYLSCNTYHVLNKVFDQQYLHYQTFLVKNSHIQVILTSQLSIRFLHPRDLISKGNLLDPRAPPTCEFVRLLDPRAPLGFIQKRSYA